MKMQKVLVAVAIFASSVSALGAQTAGSKRGGSLWADPDGKFVCELPKGWDKVDEQHGLLIMSKDLAGGILIQSYPRDGNYSSVDEFVQMKTKYGLKGEVSHPSVAGVKATRFEKEMPHHIDYVGKPTNKGSGVEREAYVVVASGKDFFVLNYTADAEDYSKHQADFERFLSTFRLKPPKK